MNELIPNPGKNNIPLATDVSDSQKPIASKPIAIWLLVILVVLLLGTTGVFAYKYYELKQQIDQQSFSSVTPVKTTTSLSPTLSPQPTTGPTVNWEVYNYLGIEFKHPKEWKAEEQIYKSGGPPQVWVYPKEGQQEGSVPSYSLRFTLLQSSQANTPKEVWLLEKQDEEAWLIKYQYEEILKESEVKINNLSGFQIVSKALDPKTNRERPLLIGKEIIFVNQGTEVRVTYGEWITEDEFEQGNYWPKHGETVDQILSTFKFTN